MRHNAWEEDPLYKVSEELKMAQRSLDSLYHWVYVNGTDRLVDANIARLTVKIPKLKEDIKKLEKKLERKQDE